MATQIERTNATRTALIRAGRSLFAERGYAEVSVAELAERAGVTTGAIYHQFESKQGLFKAIYDELVQGVWARVQSSRGADGEPSLVADCEAYLDACAEPAFHRITIDGPAVIGWDQILDDTQTMIQESLTAAQARGEIAGLPVAPLSRMLAAALKEAGMVIASSADPVTARAEASESARYLLSGLLTDASARAGSA
jgi:AcrR family transcriptional regulator